MPEPLDLDLVKIMAEHEGHVVTPAADAAEFGLCDIPLNGYEGPRDHCLPYRLAEALAAQPKPIEVAFPLANRFTVGERCVIPGYDGSYPDHRRNRWGYVAEIRRVVETKVREELVVTLDGEEPRAINPDVVAHADDWRFARDEGR
jgi:hypothetical protein